MTGKTRRAAEPIEREIETALDPGRFVSDRACFSFVGDIEEVQSEVAKLIQTGPARATALTKPFSRAATRRPTRSTTRAAASACS